MARIPWLPGLMGLIIKTDKKAVTGFDGEERNQKTRRFRSFRKA
jgi:hypothetical protein